MSVHTPGPWVIDWETGTIHAQNVAGGMHIAEARRGHMPWEQRQANVRLIAAAPELLAALESARDGFAAIMQRCEEETVTRIARNMLGNVCASIESAKGELE